MTTSNPDITIYDGITGETIIRPMTDEEYAEFLASLDPEPTEP
jgi:hypothetical protein